MSAQLQEVFVPDIGDFKNIEIIEILVKPGDVIQADDPLITLESDKAAMEVPAPRAGVVKSMLVKVGDRVSQGTPIMLLEPGGQSESAAAPVAEAAAVAKPEPSAAKAESAPAPVTKVASPTPETPKAPPVPAVTEAASGPAHASPAVRKFARELGADLSRITGSGDKGRILKGDVQAFIKQSLQSGGQTPAVGGAFAFPMPPRIDFSQFGDIEQVELPRIKKLSGAHLHRSWVGIPHVTQYDQADITDLEAFRVSLKAEAEKSGVKLTFLPFVIKAIVAALKAYPNFNASLTPDAQSLVVKRYYNIGVAVDTPDGLVVPVVREADRKSIFELAAELAEVSARARGKKLRGGDMEGGCFTITSLGGIGGTAFTPIINAPEVAILGLSRAATQPVYRDGQFVPRLMLPLSLSYDHRVIDGAEAARFITHLSALLADLRRALL